MMAYHFIMSYICFLFAENLKSHLQKFRIHRDRNRGDYSSYYELSTRQGEGKTGDYHISNTSDVTWISGGLNRFIILGAKMKGKATTLARFIILPTYLGIGVR